ncbi:Uncharacterised protein [Salmonella enterica subsp. diarizonae]|nr:Uncharacterised protein [Salmonella enterica subsp. diarizonae]
MNESADVKLAINKFYVDENYPIRILLSASPLVLLSFICW